ncbi:DEAD/DEAH box helicase [Mycolicibacterium monacense]|uniref:DEAD/DEAH box helicase n=1 Tax=Mycolicibacterium monacense TaxID=85693 RepID=UPI0010424FA7|nr:DEAD/DEAH box helicase [Mycolicibacterium monacense]
MSQRDQRRMIARLKEIMSAREAREALTRVSRDSRGRSIEWIVAAAETQGTPSQGLKLADQDLISLLVELAGPDLLADRLLRRIITDKSGPRYLDRLHDYESGVRGKRTHRSKVDAIAQRKWHPGRSWAVYFVRTLGYPLVYAGSKSEASLPDSIEVEPCVALPPLRDFQTELRDQVIGILAQRVSNRAILTLPTGAGKTRTTVEALLTWRIRQADPPTILWIAQSDELCEQAVQSFREVWFDLGHRDAELRESLTIGRLWGDGNAVPVECGVVVASIQKLRAAERGKGRALRPVDIETLGASAGVIVIDEAHRALATSYTGVLHRLGMNFRKKSSDTALIGLTATPRRTSHEETRRLRRRFNDRVLNAPALGEDPVQTLRGAGVLARINSECLDYDAQPTDLDRNLKYAQYFDEFEDIHPDVLRRLGEEHQRNRRILDRVMELDPSWPTLLFACSTQHAQAMAILLRRGGRSAGCILGSTRSSTRRALIEQFRAGQLSVLCNYGVLTTGFDAPKVRCVVVARPTASPILYEQMIGRGMRGPTFGGTDRCLLIDVEDNLRWHNGQATIAYPKLEDDMRHAD